MPKKLIATEIENLKISDTKYKRNLSGEKKVDINILLNRVKTENVKEKKKECCIYHFCTFVHMHIRLFNF